MSDERYELDTLIKLLEDIKEKGSGNINYPKAYLTLALEIRNIKEWIDERHWDV